MRFNWIFFVEFWAGAFFGYGMSQLQQELKRRKRNKILRTVFQTPQDVAQKQGVEAVTVRSYHGMDAVAVDVGPVGGVCACDGHVHPGNTWCIENARRNRERAEKLQC